MPNKLNQMIAMELGEKFPKGANFVIVGFNKLTSPETTELRRNLRASKIQVEVVKNTVAACVLEANGLGAANEYLTGPCAIVTGKVELPDICKILTEYTKKVENRLFIRGGVLDALPLTPEGVVKLASIPPRPVLYSKMLGSIQTPVTQLAGAFQSIARSLACALEAIRNQKESSAPPADPQPAASEPAPSPA